MFQELQHAIDYLDHAPAGFFSVDAKGDIVYLNATLANWLDQDLAQVGSGGLKLADLVAGDGAALLTTLRARAGRSQDRSARSRSANPQRPHAAGAAVSQARLRRRRRAGRFAHAGAQSRPRRRHRSAARRRNPLHAVLPPHADGDRDHRQAWRRRAHQSAVRAAVPRTRAARRARTARSSRSSPSATAPALEAAIAQAAQGKGDIAPVDATLAGDGERFGRFYVTAVEEEERDQEAAIVYALETTAQRELENKVTQQQKMELVGQLAGGIAHDFNNVLSAIMMATDFLLNAHKPTDPSFQDIMQIKQNANRAASLVRHLLAFSRKQTLRPQVLDLGEVLERSHHAAAPADRREGRRSTSCTAATCGRSRSTFRSSSR